ncbi:hypothetical protein K3555_18365 [Leisingera sp. M527]|nr:hypothetical protein [Leisingera sp. M527]UWQ32468.1 hypothetical protein K3555_18365 [Leisingera sp. M527]
MKHELPLQLEINQFLALKAVFSVDMLQADMKLHSRDPMKDWVLSFSE